MRQGARTDTSPRPRPPVSFRVLRGVGSRLHLGRRLPLAPARLRAFGVGLGLPLTHQPVRRFGDEGVEQAPRLLAWTGRGYNAVKNGATFAPQWYQNMAVYDVFIVPKG